MRVGIISDIHGNLQALDVVLDDIGRRGLDAVYCLGDLVGYAPFPNEVIDRIRAAEIPTIMGNYDDGVGFDQDDCGCVYRVPGEAELGRQSLLWTRQTTTAENKVFLQALPIQLRRETQRCHLLFVHGSPRRINEYLYADRPAASFERIARLAGAEVLFFGHTHLPYQKTVARTLFVNAGSVGKPKDGDPRAAYALFSSGLRSRVEFRRVSYDVAAAAAAVRRVGLPVHFALQLETGGQAALPAPAVVPLEGATKRAPAA